LSKLFADTLRLFSQNNLIKNQFTSLPLALKGKAANTEEISAAQELIKKASAVYFLGFGYHPTNMERLGIEILKKVQKIRGTCYKLPLQKQNDVARLDLWRYDHKGEVLFDKKVFEFLCNDVDFNAI
jgi:hypothetical protein